MNNVNPTRTEKRLNSVAPTASPNSVGVVAQNECEESRSKGRNTDEKSRKETTTQWVQRTFNGNVVATNTSCQDIPSQDTRVEGQLVKNTKNELTVDAKFEKFRSNERIKWSGGRLWADQTEEDSEEGEIQDEMQSDEETGGDEIEEKKQSVSGNANVSRSIEDQNLFNKD